MNEEKCGYCIYMLNCKNYGTTDISKGYKATSKSDGFREITARE